MPPFGSISVCDQSWQPPRLLGLTISWAPCTRQAGAPAFRARRLQPGLGDRLCGCDGHARRHGPESMSTPKCPDPSSPGISERPLLRNAANPRRESVFVFVHSIGGAVGASPALRPSACGCHVYQPRPPTVNPNRTKQPRSVLQIVTLGFQRGASAQHAHHSHQLGVRWTRSVAPARTGPVCGLKRFDRVQATSLPPRRGGLHDDSAIGGWVAQRVRS